MKTPRELAREFVEHSDDFKETTLVFRDPQEPHRDEEVALKVQPTSELGKAQWADLMWILENIIKRAREP